VPSTRHSCASPLARSLARPLACWPARLLARPLAHSQDYFYSKLWTRAPAYIIGAIAATAYLTRLARQRTETAKRDADAPRTSATATAPDDLSPAPSPSPTAHTRAFTASAAAVSLAQFGRRFGLLLAALLLLGGVFYAPTALYRGILQEAGSSQWSTTAVRVFTTLSRPAWSLGVAAMLYACVIGSGGWVNTALSLPLWEPLARLTFATYLLHPVVMSVVYGGATEVLHYSWRFIAVNYAFFTAATWTLAGVAYVLVEHPVAASEGVMMGACGRRGAHKH